jgi:histone H3/H4
METSEPETVVPEAEIHNVAVASNKKSAEKKSTTTTTSTAATTKSTSQKLPSAVEFEPPLACVRRILKHALPATTNVGKDASAAFARACGIFIIYVTACANDFARENKRQTITANDVMAAIKVGTKINDSFILKHYMYFYLWLDLTSLIHHIMMMTIYLHSRNSILMNSRRTWSVF